MSLGGEERGEGKASFVMQTLSYPTETTLTNEITRNIIVQSFKDSLQKPLRRRPEERGCLSSEVADKAGRIEEKFLTGRGESEKS